MVGNWGRESEDAFWAAVKEYSDKTLDDLVINGCILTDYMNNHSDVSFSGEYQIKQAQHDAIDFVLKDRVQAMGIEGMKEYFSEVKTLFKLYSKQTCDEIDKQMNYLNDRYLKLNGVSLNPFGEKSEDPDDIEYIMGATLPQKMQFADKLKSLKNLYEGTEKEVQIDSEIDRFRSEYLHIKKDDR